MKNEREYIQKQAQRKDKLLCDFYKPGLTQLDKDIINLEIMECEIHPGSRWWRWGYKGCLRRVRKILIQHRKELSKA